ncbi:rod shape-determining protein MreD [candidate division KSB1 bacterium]|nr:rod shape-determining protein MreD [candidate division KSB1 bacterium]
MRMIAYSLIFIIVFLIQSSFVDLISIRDVKPDLLLIFLVLMSKYEGRIGGTVAGFIIGLFQDIWDTQFIGLSSLCKSVSGFVAGQLKNREPEPGLVTLGTFLLIIGLLHNLVFFTIKLLGSGYGFFIIVFRFVLPSTLYTLVIGLIIFSILPEKWLKFQQSNE